MTLFDRYIAVDWSGAGKRTSRTGGENAIWIASTGRNAAEWRDYATSRAEAVRMICAELNRRMSRSERVLIGFDFSFGWPAGFAAAVSGQPNWRALWDALDAEINDAEDNAHDAFAWAAEMNGRLAAPGPFWGEPYGERRPNMPAATKPPHFSGFAEFRHCEIAMARALRNTPKSVWQLAYNGAVGAQSLLGVRAVSKIRQSTATSRIWPFETGWTAPKPKRGDVIIVELYFDLLGDGRNDATTRVKDARQVRGGAHRLAELDDAGDLAGWFACSNDSIRDLVEREEGWTLGA